MILLFHKFCFHSILTRTLWGYNSRLASFCRWENQISLPELSYPRRQDFAQCRVTVPHYTEKGRVEKNVAIWVLSLRMYLFLCAAVPVQTSSWVSMRGSRQMSEYNCTLFFLNRKWTKIKMGLLPLMSSSKVAKK